MDRAPRGRRQAGSGTREAIAAAARRQFGERGYRRASIRTIAAEAGVDPRLVQHYFGSKQELFVAVVELPIDPAAVLDRLLADAGDQLEPGAGRHLAAIIVGVLDSQEGRETITGLIRAAASEEEAARMVRELVTQRLVAPVARRVARDHAELRAGLIGSQVVGLAFARHVVGVDALAVAPSERLIEALGPVFDHYLSGPLS